MEVQSFRAKSLQEALVQVRQALGPDASILHTREVTGGLPRWLGGGRQIEVIATNEEVDIPSRWPEPAEQTPATYEPLVHNHDPRSAFQRNLAASAAGGVELSHAGDLSVFAERDDLHSLTRELVQNEWSPELAHETCERLRLQALGGDAVPSSNLRSRLASFLETELPLCRPIHLESGERRIVALIGPTGVGKTTTIAKLAANFGLRQRRRVGLITVDTYRIAAVEQLRTYADIIDVPMEVVASQRDMREAIRRMSHLDLLLIDTAGRSPRDEIKLQELRSILQEAQPDEVHLVLSATASASSLVKSAQQFAGVGSTGLVLTKLDEAHGLGNLLPVLRSARLPLSYVTHGQNVPDDIAPADRRRLAKAIAGFEREPNHA
ncbi:MAG TPA: flagellar biosynthesis protein FlhF [Pirellulaceae bacterium]|nr:flagellar biosynthesis protein FlhF [Pirellulaceae bacterium]